MERKNCSSCDDDKSGTQLSFDSCFQGGIEAEKDIHESRSADQ